MREYSEDDYPSRRRPSGRRFKAAAVRWLVELEADVREGFDQAALEEEHEDG